MPTTTGGTAPVAVACTPPSGSTFPAGRSNATCTATDARQQTDMCTFAVTVEVVPVLSATRFSAFGDSITEGKFASGDPAPLPYPADLKTRLAARYMMQDFTVSNDGVGGETSVGGTARLPGVLSARNPEVLLLVEGVNDLALGDSSRVAVVINNLRSMVQTAKGRGIQVFLGTLLPEIPGGSRAGALTLIVPTNDQIRALAASQSIPLVDLYQAFIGLERTLIGEDGLHPNAAGYQKIAETFFNAIRGRLELSPTRTSTLTFNASARPARTY
jgi:acyl-CoA thioesterase-1